MSVSAHLKATIMAPGGPRQVLEALLGAGWTHGKGEGWKCVPLGDEDEWDGSVFEGEGADVVLGLLDAKMNAGEVFGVELYWVGTDVGVTMLLWPQEKSTEANAVDVLLGADINRVKKGPRATDSEWYTSRLLSAFHRTPGLRVERSEWVEID